MRVFINIGIVLVEDGIKYGFFFLEVCSLMEKIIDNFSKMWEVLRRSFVDVERV